MATTRMMGRAGFSYRYDRAGNLDSVTTGSPSWKYVYDALDRLVEVRQNGTLIARYAYDVLSRRIVKRVSAGGNAGYLRMIYRGGEVIAEADSNGALTFGYTRGLETDNLVAIRRYSDSSHYYVVHDPLGSVRGLSKRDGTWIASWRYSIYGAVIDSTGSAPLPVRYRWTGREYDTETGLYFFRSRFYDPAAQRFVQEDPIGFAGGANVYAYADGNPTNARDPDGLAADIPLNHEEISDPILRYPDDNFCGTCGGGGGDWDGDGVDDFQGAFDDQWSDGHPEGEAHIFTSCNKDGCESVVVYLNKDETAALEAAIQDASWPTWYGVVGNWDPKKPQPQLTLIGGGTHGVPGTWTVRDKGPIDKWPQDWMPNPSDWGPKLGRTVESYRGYYQNSSFTTRMEAFGVVWRNGHGYFVAKPSTSCQCSILPLFNELWP